ncbi:MAG: single-stranded DNA-binding protein [Nocardioidaceae bacterium]|nr:single-stranded DNA-binding protein [Nocardioidaceae bacterium]MCL2613357.1 single-stranded DNA-binding protein [Nocardioidaceae bacterium]
MSNDTMVTVQGWIAADPVIRSVGGFPVANFRVGCTPRRFHRGRQEWVDGPTAWYSVSAWRVLAANCERSLKKGDPVIVHGRLQQRSYVNAGGVEVVALEIEAVTVGHDLTRGFDSFLRSPAREPAGVVSTPPEPRREPDAVAETEATQSVEAA